MAAPCMGGAPERPWRPRKTRSSSSLTFSPRAQTLTHLRHLAHSAECAMQRSSREVVAKDEVVAMHSRRGSPFHLPGHRAATEIELLDLTCNAFAQHGVDDHVSRSDRCESLVVSNFGNVISPVLKQPIMCRDWLPIEAQKVEREITLLRCRSGCIFIEPSSRLIIEQRRPFLSLPAARLELIKKFHSFRHCLIAPTQRHLPLCRCFANSAPQVLPEM